MPKCVRAYHFVGKGLRDGSAIPLDGEWLTFDGPVKMCKSGLHASLYPFDALQYAPGETLCLVDCDDIVDEQSDKLVCRRRRIVARIDATELLWDMSRWCALQVIHLWDAPLAVREYLETGKEELRDAAWAAAWAAAAARDAAGAARDAAGAARAARDAGWAAGAAARAAGDAAWAAAWAAGAARDAAGAARDAQKTMFLDAVQNEFIAMGVKV